MPQIGDKVFEAGDWIENTKQIVVTEDNINIVNQFWNSLFYDNELDADKQMYKVKAEYGEWLYRGL